MSERRDDGGCVDEDDRSHGDIGDGCYGEHDGVGSNAVPSLYHL